ncbi:MAG: hypothetical protein HYV47_00870 [Candidatus Nealsonbacteria bacterium]|nr:hypothetical protein [Candidatus Nealsonbacteria bacterium]
MSIIAKFLSVLILISFSTSGQVLQKRGVLNLDLTDFEFSLSNTFFLFLRIISNYWLVAGLFFMVLTFLLYLLILSRTQLNIVYPVMISGTIIFVAIASSFIFKENLSLPQVFGIVVVISGIFLMFFKRPAPGLKN